MHHNITKTFNPPKRISRTDVNSHVVSVCWAADSLRVTRRLLRHGGRGGSPSVTQHCFLLSLLPFANSHRDSFHSPLFVSILESNQFLFMSFAKVDAVLFSSSLAKYFCLFLVKASHENSRTIVSNWLLRWPRISSMWTSPATLNYFLFITFATSMSA